MKKDTEKIPITLDKQTSSQTSKERALPAYWTRIIKEKGLNESRIEKWREHLGKFEWPTGAEQGDSYGGNTEDR